MKNTNIIRNFLITGFLPLLLVIASQAAPLVRKATGPNPNSLTVAMLIFRNDLGGTDNGTGGSFTSGRRELDWEEYVYNGYPGYGSPSQLPYDFYNKIHPRGIIFNTLYVPSTTSPTMLVSKPTNPPGQYVNFQIAGGNSSAHFKPFSGTRVFANHYDPNVNVNFTIPGTKTPATVNGFGMVFTDVDYNYSTYITLYDEAGKPVYGGYVEPEPNGFSFVGVTFNDGTRIARADIKLGYHGIAGSAAECDFDDCHVDRVGLDNMIFGEPRALEYHPSDFDGDGSADMAVYRPIEGKWFIMNSGSNTSSVVNFGLNGDIPIDGDFDGDSRSDMTLYRPSTGAWHNLRSSDGQSQVIPFGVKDDKPVAGDYDKDGKTDIAVWRPSNGNYYIFRSSDNQVQITQWGAKGDIPIGAGASYPIK